MKTRNWMSVSRSVAIAAASLWLTISLAWSQDFKRSTDDDLPASSAPAATIVEPPSPNVGAPAGGAIEFKPIISAAIVAPPAPSAPAAASGAIGIQPVRAATMAVPPLPETASGIPQAMPLTAVPTANVANTAVPAKVDADPTGVKQIVTDYLTELENKKKAADATKKKEAEEKGHEVGSDLNLRAKWVEGTGLIFATEHEDWRLHIGGRFQFEPVFFQQPISLRGTATGGGGIPAATKTSGNGLGIQDDGAYFRRVRLRTDGVGYETIEFALEVDFEQLDYITYDHLWVGMKDVPFFGTVRVGNHKVPVGMENMGSDYHLTMLERSSPADAFSVLFAPGLWISNNFLDDNVCFQTMVHKTQPVGFYTSAFGNGNYADSTRLTWTPLYEDEGREIVHIGASYQYRTGNIGREITPGGTGSAFGDSQDVLRFRARSDLRDGVGISSSTATPLAVGSLARYVDTGFLLAKSAQTVVPEFLTIWGPFSVQAEGYLVKVDDARNLLGPSKVGTSFGNPFFWGGYAEASYFITGERRGYDRRNGLYDRPVLNENAFMVRDSDGHLRWNLGAWQVAYRYSYLDLNSNGIAGGTLGQHTFGLNWYINNTTKVQFQYNISQRETASPAISGTVHGFGMLAQWYF